jgi:hypothetical protein
MKVSLKLGRFYSPKSNPEYLLGRRVRGWQAVCIHCAGEKFVPLSEMNPSFPVVHYVA